MSAPTLRLLPVTTATAGRGSGLPVSIGCARGPLAALTAGWSGGNDANEANLFPGSGSRRGIPRRRSGVQPNACGIACAGIAVSDDDALDDRFGVLQDAAAQDDYGNGCGNGAGNVRD